MKQLDYNVPFISNTVSDKQCLQAAYGMIRQYFDPQLAISWDEWADITGFVPDKGTWSMAGLMWFKDNGYDVVHVAQFDYSDFALRGPDYLMDTLDEETAKIDISNTDFVVEQARALRFLTTGIWIKRIPTMTDVEDFLRNGYLVKCAVNLHFLNGKKGYLSHAVVVKGVTEKEVIIHDPGLPARPNRRISVAKFVAAWKYEGPDVLKLDAIRKMPQRLKMHRNFGRSATRVVPRRPSAVAV